VVGFLVKEHGMSYRTGHQILALMMQTVADRNIPRSQATPHMLEGAISYLARGSLHLCHRFCSVLYADVTSE
jgi:hypothetical protein